MKNRDLGIEDELVGLYFERESKRLLNLPSEVKHYGWDDFSFISSTENVSDDDIPFYGR